MNMKKSPSVLPWFLKDTFGFPQPDFPETCSLLGGWGRETELMGT